MFCYLFYTMKQITHTYFEIDYYIEPKWLNTLLLSSMKIVYALLICTISIIYIKTHFNNLSIVWVIIALTLLYLSTTIYIAYTNSTHDIILTSDNLLILPRRHILISSILSINMYKKENFWGTLNYIDINTEDQQTYTITIKEPDDFCNEIVKRNKNIIITNQN